MNQKGGAKADTIVKLVLVCFISLFSFSVGTFVGKQFSDSQHKLANLEADYRSPASSKENVQNDQALTEEDVAALTEEFMKAEKDGPGENVDSHTMASAKPGNTDHKTGKTGKTGKHEAESEVALASSMQKIAKIEKIAENIAVGKPPTEGKDRERKPSSLTNVVATSTIGKFTVQMASFTTKTEAERQVTKLQGEGVSAYIIPAVVNGKTWYRVSVGVFEHKKDAISVAQEFTKKNKAAIVQKIVE